jgi:hypothetical protein
VIRFRSKRHLHIFIIRALRAKGHLQIFNIAAFHTSYNKNK